MRQSALSLVLLLVSATCAAGARQAPRHAAIVMPGSGQQPSPPRWAPAYMVGNSARRARGLDHSACLGGALATSASATCARCAGGVRGQHAVGLPDAASGVQVRCPAALHATGCTAATAPMLTAAVLVLRTQHPYHGMVRWHSTALTH